MLLPATPAALGGPRALVARFPAGSPSRPDPVGTLVRPASPQGPGDDGEKLPFQASEFWGALLTLHGRGPCDTPVTTDRVALGSWPRTCPSFGPQSPPTTPGPGS